MTPSVYLGMLGRASNPPLPSLDPLLSGSWKNSLFFCKPSIYLSTYVGCSISVGLVGSVVGSLHVAFAVPWTVGTVDRPGKYPRSFERSRQSVGCSGALNIVLRSSSLGVLRLTRALSLRLLLAKLHRPVAVPCYNPFPVLVGTAEACQRALVALLDCSCPPSLVFVSSLRR